MHSDRTAEGPPIILAGDLDFSGTRALTETLSKATGFQVVTIDLSKVSFLDAAVLGCFVHLLNEMKKTHGHPIVRFVDVPHHLLRVFRITELDALFHFGPVALPAKEADLISGVSST